jgi:poly(3-hydroxybutyrate) depolymerase
VNYQAYEMAHVMLSPMRIGARALRIYLTHKFNPFSVTPQAKSIAAACQVFEELTHRYGKPEFGITETKIVGLPVEVTETVVMEKPFCRLLHFERDESKMGKRFDPKVLIVAPMSGHYATLIRGTIEAMIPEHDVFVTDWSDARDVPLSLGQFDFDDFIDYLIDFIQYLGTNTHLIAVCQPAVPVLAATALMASRDMDCQPLSLTLMGGPIDVSRAPTKVTEFSESRSLDWFEQNVISVVPFPNPGFGRRVYPGFLQLTGFVSMNLDRHVDAHVKHFHNLVRGDCDPVARHQQFYEEYMAVMDLPAEFYLQTIEKVFHERALAKGTLVHRGEKVDCSAIRQTALMTIEGENDDICGVGQTEAAHDLCDNIPIDMKYHYVQPGVGHYGVFNGRRWSTEIQPRIREMIRTVQFKRRIAAPPPLTRCA